MITIRVLNGTSQRRVCPTGSWCTPACPVYTTSIRTYRRGSGHLTCKFRYRPAGTLCTLAGRCTTHIHKIFLPTPGTNQLPSWYWLIYLPRLKQIPFLGNLSKLCQSSTHDLIWICPPLRIPNALNDESKERDVFIFVLNQPLDMAHSLD